MSASTRLLAALGFPLILAIPAQSATIRVPAEQPTIQAGINFANPGDTVLVASGTYTGPGNKNLNLMGESIVLRSEAGSDSTVIDCEGQGRGFYFQAGENHSTLVEGFTIRNGVVSGPFPDGWGGGILCIGSSPTIANCVISGNAATGGSGSGAGVACYDSSPRVVSCNIAQNSASGRGGGLHCHSFSAPMLENCVVSGNTASSGGGISCVANSSPHVVDCIVSSNSAGSGFGGGFNCDASSTPTLPGSTLSGNTAYQGGGFYFEGNSTASLNDATFSSNTAVQGGGMYCSSSAPTLTGCTFLQNYASGDGGGGIYCSYSSPNMVNCRFSANTGNGGGGGLLCSSSSPIVSRCVLVGNSADGGGGIYSEEGSSPTIEHCTFYGNWGGFAGGGGLYVSQNSGSPTLQNTIISFGPFGEAVRCAGTTTPTLICCDLYANLGGDWVGCIASQLGQNGNFFANPLFCDATNADFTLRAQSLCAPNNSPAGCGLIGALPVGCGGTDVVEEVPGAELRLTVSPNPVRGVATFEFGAQAAALDIFDSAGRLIDRVVPNDAGVRWSPGASVPAGVYFARLSGGVGSAVAKFLYLR